MKTQMKEEAYKYLGIIGKYIKISSAD